MRRNPSRENRQILSWLRNHQGTLVVLLGQMHAGAQTGVPWDVAGNSDVAPEVIYSKERLRSMNRAFSARLSTRQNS